MNKVWPFLRKEFLENFRSGRLTFLVILFSVFGIMNPAIAKLTPWILRMLAEPLAKSGITFKEIEITALQSWEQFYKNIPIVLIVLVVIFGGIFSNEYARGTLTPLIVKGLSKTSIFLSKYIIVFCTWTAGFWLCYMITYVYNDIYWDNAGIPNVQTAAFLWWFFGIWIISIEMMFAINCHSSSTVILLVGVVFFASYILSFFARLKNIVPTCLMNGYSFLTGAAAPESIMTSVYVTLAMCILAIVVSILLIRRKIM